MFDSLLSSPSLLLSASTFNKVHQLLQELAEQFGESATLVTEVDCQSVISFKQGDRLSVFASNELCIILWGQATSSAFTLSNKFNQLQAQEFYQVHLSFEGQEFHRLLTSSHTIPPNLAKALQFINPYSIAPSPLHQSFIQGLLNLYALESNSCLLPETNYPKVSIFQPFQDALEQQIRQERVLNQLGRQIQQSMELSDILSTAVTETQQFLQIEHLAIYQFDVSPRMGSKVKQVAGADGPSLVIHSWGNETVDCIDRASEQFSTLGTERFHPPSPQSIGIRLPLVTKTGEPFCSLHFLPKPLALLTTPIQLHQHLWGVLVAYETHNQRQWKAYEVSFMEQVAQTLAIAIQQSQLYSQLREQTEQLEQLVNERTRELHSALLTAQSASRAKTEFLATMSHELRTPLTCVIGMSATLLRYATVNSSRHRLPEYKQHQYLRTIYESGEQLLVLINDILDLSQVESGKTILELLDLVPSKVAAQALQIVQETANKARVNLRLDLNIPVKYDHLIADHQRLQQILLNLLSNAIKFTPEGGEVTLRAWSEDEVIVFQIKDNGIGISEEHRPLLFQRFQQLDSSYRRKYGGTGLGLALTKQLVELHQGRIEVESILDKGSSFTVRLPLRTTPIPILKPDILSLSTTPQGRIVLIEDQEEWGIPICDILTTAGYQVVWMVEGLGATQQIQILRPQLIITKLNLDQSEDYKIITRLRQIIPSRELKIMALTSQPIHLSFPNMDNTMIDDYLVKPFEPQQLLTKIINLI